MLIDVNWPVSTNIVKCLMDTITNTRNGYYFSLHADKNYRPLEGLYLFNKDKFLKKDLPHELIQFYIYKENAPFVIGKFNLFVQNHVGYSPIKGSFGSIEFKEGTPTDVIESFVDFILKWCEGRNLRSVIIKNFPFAYNSSNSTVLFNIFFTKGFRILNSEVNSHIPISKRPFEENIHHSKRRSLRKCIGKNFTFQLEADPELEMVYDIIKDCRDAKGYPTSLTFSELEKMFRDFPEFLLFTVRDGKTIIALSVCIVINRDILYNFYPADKLAYRKYSPVTMIASGIYLYGQKNNFSCLDMGTSSVNGKINQGLIGFKRQLGARESLKLTLEKTF